MLAGFKEGVGQPLADPKGAQRFYTERLLRSFRSFDSNNQALTELHYQRRNHKASLECHS